MSVEAIVLDQLALIALLSLAHVLRVHVVHQPHKEHDTQALAERMYMHAVWHRRHPCLQLVTHGFLRVRIVFQCGRRSRRESQREMALCC